MTNPSTPGPVSGTDPADETADRPDHPDNDLSRTEAPVPVHARVRYPGAHLRTSENGPGGTGKKRRRAKQRSTTRNIVEWVVVIGAALLIALVVRTFLVQTYYIPSGSMEPTLSKGDRVLVNKLSYQWGAIKPGQVVVFDRPGGPSPDGIDVLIKRVIAVGGDEVEGRDGIVYRNGEPLEEKYLPEGTRTQDFEAVLLEDGELWLMGDNRGNSEDSKTFGPIPEGDVVGRAFIIIWPLGNLSWL